MHRVSLFYAPSRHNVIAGERKGNVILCLRPYHVNVSLSFGVLSPVYQREEAFVYVLADESASFLVCRTVTFARDGSEYLSCFYC